MSFSLADARDVGDSVDNQWGVGEGGGGEGGVQSDESKKTKPLPPCSPSDPPFSNQVLKNDLKAMKCNLVVSLESLLPDLVISPLPCLLSLPPSSAIPCNLALTAEAVPFPITAVLLLLFPLVPDGPAAAEPEPYPYAE